MPADIEACAKAVGDKAESPFALCNWMKAEGKGYFAHAEDGPDRAQAVAAAMQEYAESAAKNEKSGPKLATVKDVEIFQAGEHREGKTYTVADLNRMAENAVALKAFLKPPVVTGHEEDQSFLENSGYPSAGRVVGLHNEFHDEPCLACHAENSTACAYCEGTGKRYTQLADFADVPQTIARLINGRAYNSVSAEVYDDFEGPDGQHHGKALRRVALLGGELPQIKTLADLPLADYSERPARRATLAPKEIRRRESAGTFLCFSEVRPMTTTATPPAKPKAKRNKLAKFSDKAKATWKKFADEQPKPDGEYADAPPAGVSRDEMIQMLQEYGFATDILEKMDDPELAEIIRVYKSGMQEMAEEKVPPEPPKTPEAKMGETPPDTTKAYPPGAKLSEPPMATPSTDPKKIVMHYSEGGEQKTLEIDRTTHQAFQLMLKPITDTLGAARQDVQKFQEAEKKKSIDARLDVLIKQGKVLPAEIDAGLKDQLYRADGVQKFSDGLTELDKQLAILEKRPAIAKFHEIGKTGPGGTATAFSENAEVAAVEQHYEQFAETFRKTGTSKDDIVKAYKSAAQREPGLTAKAFLKI